MNNELKANVDETYNKVFDLVLSIEKQKQKIEEFQDEYTTKSIKLNGILHEMQRDLRRLTTDAQIPASMTIVKDGVSVVRHDNKYVLIETTVAPKD